MFGKPDRTWSIWESYRWAERYLPEDVSLRVSIADNGVSAEADSICRVFGNTSVRNEESIQATVASTVRCLVRKFQVSDQMRMKYVGTSEGKFFGCEPKFGKWQQPILLGRLIEAGEECISIYGPSVPVAGDISPEIESYRGYYSHASLWHPRETANYYITIGEFTKRLKNQIGKYIYGYKGGVYIVTPYCPVWWAEYGSASQKAIIGIRFYEGYIQIVPKFLEYNSPLQTSLRYRRRM